MIHTPHRDKKKGTLRSMDVCAEHRLDPSMVIIDHNNEETVEHVLERGYWTAFSIYPSTKMGNARMVRDGPRPVRQRTGRLWPERADERRRLAQCLGR